MHGRKKFREGEGPTPEQQAADAAKYTKYLKLLRGAIAGRHTDTDFTWAGNTKLLALNPDAYTLWNQRKELLLKRFVEVSDKDAAHALVAGELQLTQKALTDRNPKSYSTWHHRKWIVQLVLQGSAPGMEAAEAAAAAEGSTPWQQHLQGAVTAEAELKLCTHFLTLDERNFHCWNYRRFIVQLGSLPLEDELAFTAQLIERNFSNYSAWHYRADLLRRLDQVSIESLRAEFDTLKAAMFTEPDDQSVWFYHRWAVRQGADLAASDASRASDWESHLHEQRKTLEELVAVAPESKWPLHALAFVRRELGMGGQVEAMQQLASLDPWHAQFYAVAASSGAGSFFGGAASSPPKESEPSKAATSR